MYTSTILFCILAFVSGLHLPPHIPPCKASDASCLKASAESAFSNLVNGDQELGIPPLDPLTMKTVSIEPKPGPINIFQKYSDTTIIGLSKAKVSEFTVNLKDCRIAMKILVPLLEAKAKYELKGQLLLFPVDAKGDVDAKFKNCEIYADGTCELFKDGNSEYLRAITTKITFAPKEAEFHLGNLLNGNEQLEKEVHKVIDDDSIAFFELMRPAAEQLWSDELKEIINDFFTKVPTHELFKD